MRTASRHGYVLARVDWRGAVRDLRPDPKYCGFASPFAPLDTSTFTTTLDEALRNFDVKTGKTVTTAPGTQAAVTVRKVEGEGSYIDVACPPDPRPGRPGRPRRQGRRILASRPRANGFVTFSVEPNGDLYVRSPGDDPRPRGSWTAMAICTLRRSQIMAKVKLGNVKGSKGDKGDRGSLWRVTDKMTGQSTSDTAFPGANIEDSAVGAHVPHQSRATSTSARPVETPRTPSGSG